MKAEYKPFVDELIELCIKEDPFLPFLFRLLREPD